MPSALTANTQIAFAARLVDIEELHLATALAEAVTSVGVPPLDAELARFVPAASLQQLARYGLRGEQFFPVPALLSTTPRLVGYYRLLYGISQKELYRRFGRFRALEEKGLLSPATAQALPDLVSALVEAGVQLLANLVDVTQGRIRDLQLLTLGAQLRGSLLNEIGRAATRVVFRRIRQAVADSAVEFESPTEIILRNSAGRQVRIAFSSDPDIAVVEQMSAEATNRLSIEIKGGEDVSNVHNRLGEAEKSHQKAREAGFTEFWTILNSPVDARAARRASPTTQRFFDLGRITNPADPEWVEFRDQLTSRLGLPASS